MSHPPSSPSGPRDSVPEKRPNQSRSWLFLLFVLRLLVIAACLLLAAFTADAPPSPPSPPQIASVPAPPPRPAAPPVAAPAALRAPASPPPVASSIGLAAHEIGSAGLIDQTPKNEDGGFKRKLYRTLTIEATLTNLDRYGSGPLDEIILWFSRDFSGHAPAVFFADHQTFEMPAATTDIRHFDCPLAFGREERLTAFGQPLRSGEKIVGWLIVVRRHDVILAAHGSDPERESLCHNLPALRSLLASSPPNENHRVE